MHEVMHEWKPWMKAPRAARSKNSWWRSLAEHQLHRDLGWSAERIAADFHGFLEILHLPGPARAKLAAQGPGRVRPRARARAAARETILRALRKLPLIGRWARTSTKPS